jgi:hypothetical protein
MMEAACTFETAVDIYLTTGQYIPEDSKLHTRRRENLKSHFLKLDTVFITVWIYEANVRLFLNTFFIFEQELET